MGPAVEEEEDLPGATSGALQRGRGGGETASLGSWASLGTLDEGGGGVAGFEGGRGGGFDPRAVGGGGA